MDSEELKNRVKTYIDFWNLSYDPDRVFYAGSLPGATFLFPGLERAVAEGGKGAAIVVIESEEAIAGIPLDQLSEDAIGCLAVQVLCECGSERLDLENLSGCHVDIKDDPFKSPLVG